jgi:membrane protein implicated in regulation of membrane protease activity
MADSTIWWLLAGASVVLELLTGTFYLLMLAIGLMAAAVAAHIGVSQTWQLVTAAVIGGGAVLAWHLLRGKREPGSASGNRDVNLDVGETLQVPAWGPDGTATVKYRGANWQVALAAGSPDAPGLYRVREVVGSRLVVEKI